ncbi:MULTISPECIES: hypothetical protein [Acinetobacter]|jgi:hypothetical protein|uniref:hypothetical protein n=1 Tax=Acinetobacter TaxID=469 RepID=UPI0013DFB1C3|nr:MULTISPECIES: hypothetical protein [Acinetobacter]MCX0343915.1 hypothetical protein [Acinetobacter radioresistens]NGP42968.1 hypothetical protein [Acinetobacter lwoffii]HRM31189.1 hypothetical protein [Acinetobacter johnsonii]
MNEIQIAATLQAMSDSLKAIFNLLDDEKKQHIEFLIKLNNQVSDSQTELKQDFLNFLSKVELQEFALIVKDSQQNIENHQKSILQFNAVIMQIRQTAMQSLEKLEQQHLDISQKITNSSDVITNEIIKNVANSAKESVTQNFLLQFKEQNQSLILSAEKANKAFITSIIEIYNHINKEVSTVTSNHQKRLSQFEADVDAFKENINIAIDSVKDSFAEVEELNKDQMKKLYESSINFRQHVLDKLNAETQSINRIFEDEINNISKNVQTNCENVLDKMVQTQALVDEKANEVSSKLNTSLTTTEKIIEKQTAYHKKLCNNLNFKYFSLNTNSLLVVAFIVLSGLCISTLIQNGRLEKDNLMLEQQNKKLNDDGVLLIKIRNESIDLTKKSISDVKKKFPGLKVTIDCKALD